MKAKNVCALLLLLCILFGACACGGTVKKTDSELIEDRIDAFLMRITAEIMKGC